MNKLYIYNMNSNGTSDLLITCNSQQVIVCIPEAVFGNIPSKHFGWSGDAQGNIDACLYGESVIMVDYSTPYNEDDADDADDADDDRTLADVVQAGEMSDLQQVIEVDITDVLERIAVSPVSDGSDVLKQLADYFPEAAEALAASKVGA